MYGYDFKAKKKTGFRGRAPGSEQEQRERKIFIFGILLLLTSMLSFGAGVFLYHRPTGSADALLQRLYSGMLCGFFRDGLTFWDLAKSYLWIVAPLLLLFVSVFGSLTFPYSALVIAGKGFLSGYTCAALLDLQSPGCGRDPSLPSFSHFRGSDPAADPFLCKRGTAFPGGNPLSSLRSGKKAENPSSRSSFSLRDPAASLFPAGTPLQLRLSFKVFFIRHKNLYRIHNSVVYFL